MVQPAGGSASLQPSGKRTYLIGYRQSVGLLQVCLQGMYDSDERLHDGLHGYECMQGHTSCAWDPWAPQGTTEA